MPPSFHILSLHPRNLIAMFSPYAYNEARAPRESQGGDDVTKRMNMPYHQQRTCLVRLVSLQGLEPSNKTFLQC